MIEMATLQVLAGSSAVNYKAGGANFCNGCAMVRVVRGVIRDLRCTGCYGQ